MTSGTNLTQFAWNCNRRASLEQTTCSRNARITGLIVGLLAICAGAALLCGMGHTAGWAFLGAGSILVLLSSSIKRVQNQFSPSPSIEIPAPTPLIVPQGSLLLPPTPLEEDADILIDEQNCRDVHQITIDAESINVKFVGAHLKIDPLFYFNKFCTQIAEQNVRSRSLALQGRVLDANQKLLGVGYGVGRGYLNEMLLGVLRQNADSFTVITSSGLVIPQAPPSHSLELFHKLGSMIMYCYIRTIHANSPPRSLITGMRFDSSLFRVAFALSANEINASFKELTVERKRGLYQTLQPKNQHLKLLNIPQWDSPDIAEARQLLEWEGFTGIPNTEPKLRVLLLQALSERLDSQLIGIHAFAKGMKSFCTIQTGSEDRTWGEKFCNSDYQVFSDKVQGSLDKNQIAAGIGGWEIKNQEIEKKLGWLRQWILDEATSQELKDFVKFQTDCNGWPEGVVTIITQDNDKPFPKVHTCGFSMGLSPLPTSYLAMNDHNYKNFIGCLKAAMTQNQAYSEFSSVL